MYITVGTLSFVTPNWQETDQFANWFLELPVYDDEANGVDNRVSRKQELPQLMFGKAPVVAVSLVPHLKIDSDFFRIKH